MIPQAFVKISDSTQQQSTELREKKRLANEVLRRVDHFIKTQDLQKALLEIRRVKEIDPRNVYALAFEERIQVLMTEQTKAQEQKVELQNQSGNKTTCQQDQYKPPSTPSSLSALQNNRSTTFPVSASIVQPQQRISSIPLPNVNGMQLQISTPILDTRKKENIPHAPQRPTIVMIDDDSQLLLVLSKIIDADGFEVTALSTSDEAYELLKTYRPDIILCDINLETSTMGGFTFFEKIQRFDHLKHVPFIFLTGFNNEMLIRTGKEMGIDDYLTKPFNEQQLLATLRGKVKRFEQFRKTQTSNVYDSLAVFPPREIHS